MSSKDPYIFENHVAVPERILKPLLGLFQSWDDPHSDDSYLSTFTTSATLLLGPSPAEGHAAIKSLRDSMINPQTGPVVDLEHNLHKLFIMASDAEAPNTQEVIMNGSIWYKLKNGVRADADWATWTVLKDQGDGDLKISYYKVYVDPSGLKSAITKMLEEGK
jgi:hypothetical protein